MAFAGAAAADVTLKGSAEMGITGGDNNAVTQFHTDIDVGFTMSGETDNGLSFGASVDLDEGGAGAAAHADDTDDGGATMFISGAFGRLTMGDTDGAFDWAMAEVPSGSGSIADNETSHAGYNSNSGLDNTFDNQILSYTYSVSGFGFIVSLELDDNDAAGSNPVIGFGATYAMGDLKAGVGYQQAQVGGFDRSIVGLSLGYTIGDLALGLNASSQEREDAAWVESQDHVGIGATYSMDAITVGANYGAYSNMGGVAGADRAGYGLSAGYDLGGGAELVFGWEATTEADTVANENSTWSFGLSMSF